MPPADEPQGEAWDTPGMVRWCRLLLDSYAHWTGRELLDRLGSPEAHARALFAAPFVVASHGTEDDPMLNYGNRMALELWEMTWAQFTRTPSRLTAEPVNRAERERMLERAGTRGWINDYRGVRISGTGRHFLVEDAIVWNVVDAEGRTHGQAATFSRWTFLPLHD
ncbi:MAG: MEKHLA domain-containing protein [Nitrospirota bacterium]|nr:MEKHLA domain-containing protein [Nitrospirota bacterium]